MYEKYIKRLLDIIFSLILIIIFSPFFLIIYVSNLIFLGYPALFKQNRPGYNERIFTLYKFRTMTNKEDLNGNLLIDEKRLTKYGRFLRKTSLDELPQLFNILKGEMSFIGPRPLAVEYLPYYTTAERKRHSIRPGITGLAQINGRNLLQWEKRFEYDISYLEKISFKNDFKIIFNTFMQIFKTNNIILRGSGKIIDFDKYRNDGEKIEYKR